MSTPIYMPLLSFAYGVFDPGTQDTVFDYDTFVDCKVEGKMKVSDFPVEEGAFATYNKVQHPYAIKVKLAITDNLLRRNAFLHALDSVMKSTRLMDVSSQNGVYLNLTLESYSYSLVKEQGVGKVLAELSFLEVRTIKPAYTTAKIPGASGAKSAGAVWPKVNPALATGDDAPSPTELTTRLRGVQVQGRDITGLRAVKPVAGGGKTATASPASAVSLVPKTITPSLR